MQNSWFSWMRKKDFKHYYIRYITGYWKLTDGEKTTTVVWIASSAHRWQIHWDNVDTTEAKASWKRCAEGHLQHTCHCCLESASCCLCVAQYDKHTQLYCLHWLDLYQTAWLYIFFNVTNCDFFFLWLMPIVMHVFSNHFHECGACLVQRW